jgi:prepilin-type processing-associated H-X9-DG protein
MMTRIGVAAPRGCVRVLDATLFVIVEPGGGIANIGYADAHKLFEP